MDYDIIGNTSIFVWRGSTVEIALDRIDRIFTNFTDFTIHCLVISRFRIFI